MPADTMQPLPVFLLPASAVTLRAIPSVATTCTPPNLLTSGTVHPLCEYSVMSQVHQDTCQQMVQSLRVCVHMSITMCIIRSSFRTKAHQGNVLTCHFVKSMLSKSHIGTGLRSTYQPRASNESSQAPQETQGLVLGSARGPGNPPFRSLRQLAKSHDGAIASAAQEESALMAQVAESLHSPTSPHARLVTCSQSVSQSVSTVRHLADSDHSHRLFCQQLPMSDTWRCACCAIVAFGSCFISFIVNVC